MYCVYVYIYIRTHSIMILSTIYLLIIPKFLITSQHFSFEFQHPPQGSQHRAGGPEGWRGCQSWAATVTHPGSTHRLGWGILTLASLGLMMF